MERGARVVPAGQVARAHGTQREPSAGYDTIDEPVIPVIAGVRATELDRRLVSSERHPESRGHRRDGRHLTAALGVIVGIVVAPPMPAAVSECFVA